MMKSLSIFGEISRIVDGIGSIFILIDRQVFECLHTAIPSVDTVDFCNFSKDHIRNLQADLLIATDVVHLIRSVKIRHFHQI